MQAVEIAVYIILAVLVGSLVITFIVGWDTKQTQEDLSKAIFKNEIEKNYDEVDKLGFVVGLYDSWKACGFGEQNRTFAFYVKKTIADKNTQEELTKELIFKELLRLNWCSSLQSAENDCGHGEDVEMDDDILLPSVVRVECLNNKLYISS